MLIITGLLEITSSAAGSGPTLSQEILPVLGKYKFVAF